VRVRVLASSIEYTDVTIRRRLYPWVRRQPPFVMGYDVVGEIDRLGDGVSGLHIGERVADMTVIRANADYCTLAANRVTSPPAWGGVGDGSGRDRRLVCDRPRDESPRRAGRGPRRA